MLAIPNRKEKRLGISQTVVLALHVDELDAPVHDDNVRSLKSPHHCAVVPTRICLSSLSTNILQILRQRKVIFYLSLRRRKKNFWTLSEERMETDRCAHLSLVVVAHGLSEAWISPKPMLQLLYLSQYFPALSKV
jgi:hypothetical protein